jgi:rare lipoprotein A
MKILLFFSVFLFQRENITSLPVPVQDTLKNYRNKPTPAIEYGTASFYHNKFQDRQTASGEIFDQEKLTAAHNSLPLHTWIRVTNMRNMKVVIVKVNDRLHKNNPRLVDLSRSAASKLGYIGRGLTWVKVEVLGKKRPAEGISKK